MHASKKIYSAVNINIPISYAAWLWAFGFIVVGLLLCGLNTDLSAIYVVKGFLNSDLGTASVYALKPGVIQHRFITAGQSVKKGDKLFLIDTTIDPISLSTEQKLIKNDVRRIERDIRMKQHFLTELEPLLKQHYISLAAYQTVRDQVQALKNKYSQLNQTLIHQKQAGFYIIRAPINGLISDLEAHTGQQVNLHQSLLTILPENSNLIAQLYVPVAKAGFLHTGAKITLRYDAYPFQHFGVAKARIHAISHSALTDNEESKPIRIGEPYYKVLAYLEQPYILLNGHKHYLQQGMTCTAVIPSLHKKLWQWLFDPLNYKTWG